MLRRLERWLHQHLFKVGWLLTKNFQSTTILYYTFFLPGVVLHEVVLWLAAGMLNVRADRAIARPQSQEIAELKLNFVRLHKSAGRLKVAIISIAPLAAGIATVWFVTNNVFNVTAALETMRGGYLESVSRGIQQLTSAPDFWVWVYFLFTVSNTMMPDPKALRGWWPVVIAVGLVSVALFVIGVGDEVLMSTIRGPISNALNLLAGTFAVIIGIDVVVIAALGTVEAVFERITGDSATFKDGKLIAMRRSEIQALKAKQEAARAKQLAKRATTPAGPPTIYALQLPIPGGPDKEPLTVAAEVLVEREERPPLTAGATSSRAGASLIPGTVTEKAATTTGTTPGRPALQPPEREVEDKEAEEQPAPRSPFAPAAPRGLTPPRPALKPPSEESEKEEKEKAAPGQRSPFGGTSSTGFTPSRPGMRPSDEDEEEEQDEEVERPRTGLPSGTGQRSPFGTPPSRPATRPPDEDEEEDEYDDYEDETEEDEAL